MSSFTRQLFRPLSPLSQCKILREQSSVNNGFKVLSKTVHQSRFYHLHPEQLMHIHKAKEVYKVCNYIDSEEYKKFLQSLGKGDDQYIDQINSEVKNVMKTYLNTKPTETNESESTIIKNLEKYGRGKKKNAASPNFGSSLLQKKQNDKSLGIRTYSIAADNISEHNFTNDKTDNIRKSTIVPIFLEKRNKAIKLEQKLKKKAKKSLPDIVKRLQKIRKLDKIKDNLKLLDSIKAKVKVTKSMTGLLEVDDLKKVKSPSKAQSLDNMTIKMSVSKSNQLPTDTLSLSHKSSLDITRNSCYSIKSSPSIRNFHGSTNDKVDDNKSIYSMNSVESLSMIEELKERAKKDRFHPNFDFVVAKQSKLNDIKKQSLVLGAKVTHPFSLFQKIKLATSFVPPKVAVKVPNKSNSHLDELCRTRKYINLTKRKKEEILFKNAKEESGNKAVKNNPNSLINNNSFIYRIS